MGVLFPWAFTLTVFISAFILLYFYRKRFDTKVVPSSLLWWKIKEERQASPWLEKLQKNVLFLLQLFVLLLLMFSLARPFLSGERMAGRHFIFIVDTSASMEARTGNASLFDRHRETIREMVRSNRRPVVTMIAAGSEPEVILREETETARIMQAINELHITYEHENMEKALQLARAFAGGKKESIVVLTDGLEEAAVAAMMAGFPVEVRNAGKKADNVSLKSFAVGEQEGELAGMAQIENEGQKVQSFLFTISGEKGILAEKWVEMGPGERKSVRVSPLPESPYYEAEIAAEDEYAVDNTWTTVNGDQTFPIYVAGEISSFVLDAMETIGLEVFRVSEKQLSEEGPGIVVTNSAHPLDFGRPVIHFQGAGEALVDLSEPASQTDDVLFQYVDLSNVYISKTVPEDFDGIGIIAQSGDYPLIQKGMKNGIPIVAIRFPLEYSDWPLHPNFPVFIYNSYHWLTRQAEFLGEFRPGEERWLNLGDHSLDVFDRDGKLMYSLNPKRDNFRAPERPGLYQAAYGDQVSYFSVLLDQEERTASSADSFSIGSAGADGGKDSIPDDSLWRWFAIGALVLLFLEWEVYRRNAEI